MPRAAGHALVEGLAVLVEAIVWGLDVRRALDAAERIVVAVVRRRRRGLLVGQLVRKLVGQLVGQLVRLLFHLRVVDGGSVVEVARGGRWLCRWIQLEGVSATGAEPIMIGREEVGTRRLQRN